jgi:TrmH family RNA methyltransferase
MNYLNKNIRIVMVHTTHPGNIGAVARVMKNMCLSELYLVKPKVFPSEEAIARSSGAVEVLENAVVCQSLQEAIADCSLVVGTSARERAVNWPVYDPRECASLMLKVSEKESVALLLGRESSGLTNEELDLCQYLVHIPSNPEYSSLNVAMAAQVLSYEILMASKSNAADENPVELPHLSSSQMSNFHEHLQQTLLDIGFIDERQSEKLMLRLKRFFFRANPSEDEMNILRGILSAAQGRKSMRKNH